MNWQNRRNHHKTDFVQFNHLLVNIVFSSLFVSRRQPNTKSVVMKFRYLARSGKDAQLVHWLTRKLIQ